MIKQINLICTDDQLYSIEYNEESPFHGDYLNNIIELCDGNTESISIKIPFTYEYVKMYDGDVEIYDYPLFIFTEIGAFFGYIINYISFIVNGLPNLVTKPRFELVGVLERFFTFCNKDEYCNKVLKYAESINNLKLLNIINSYKSKEIPSHTLDHDITDYNDDDVQIFEYISYALESRLILYSTKNKIWPYADTVYNEHVHYYNESENRYTNCMICFRNLGIIIFYAHEKVYLFLWNHHAEITIMSHNSETYDYTISTIYHDKSKKCDTLKYVASVKYDNLYLYETIILQVLGNSSCFDVTDYINSNDNIKHQIVLPNLTYLLGNPSSSNF